MLQVERPTLFAQLGGDVVLDHGLWARVDREDRRVRAAALGARVEPQFPTRGARGGVHL